MWSRVAAGCLALVCIVPGALAARNCGTAAIQVSVLDGTGAAVDGLSAEDFRVSMRGNPLRAQSMSHGLVPHSALVLLDRSASMGQSGKFELGRQIALTLAGLTPGVAQFSAYDGDASPISDARVTLVSSSVQATANPNHAMYDAMAASILAMNPHLGDMIFVVTDSPDSGSKMSAGQLQELLVAAGARLFLVLLPGGTVAPETEQLAALTGGGVYRPLPSGEATTLRSDEAVRNTTSWHSQITNVYNLEFQDQRPSEKPQTLKINMDKKKMNGGQLLAPAFMSPCSAIAQ